VKSSCSVCSHSRNVAKGCLPVNTIHAKMQSEPTSYPQVVVGLKIPDSTTDTRKWHPCPKPIHYSIIKPSILIHIPTTRATRGLAMDAALPELHSGIPSTHTIRFTKELASLGLCFTKSFWVLCNQCELWVLVNLFIRPGTLLCSAWAMCLGKCCLLYLLCVTWSSKHATIFANFSQYFLDF
jgi:hypothetical protein